MLVDRDGAATQVSLTQDEIESLQAVIRGTVLVPGSDGYDAARQVWNGVIDRHPAAVIRCHGVPDVVEAVRFARGHPLPVSIRAGGHQVAGSGVCDDGIVIDVGPMTGVHVDPVARTARVQAGARWTDVDRATQLFGLATTGGEVGVTGVAGLTLGGGMGALQRAFGLACDSLLSLEIVTADGVVRTASPHEHPDLFWAARGGGRGLGVVTSFEFGLRPLGPDVAVAQVAYAVEDAEVMLRRFRDLALDAPDSISPKAVLWTIPAIPQLPAEVHGRHVVLAVAVYAGDPAEAEPVLAPYRALAEPVLDMSGTMPYAAVQSAFDFFFPDGGRYYFKSHFLDEWSDEAIALTIERAQERPNEDSFVVIRTLGGAIGRVSADESAYAHRAARFNLSIDCVWDDAASDDEMIGWARRTWSALEPYANGGVYLNFSGFDDDPDVSATNTFGPSLARLERVRAEYDPSGLFDAAARGRRRAGRGRWDRFGGGPGASRLRDPRPEVVPLSGRRPRVSRLYPDRHTTKRVNESADGGSDRRRRRR